MDSRRQRAVSRRWTTGIKPPPHGRRCPSHTARGWASEHADCGGAAVQCDFHHRVVGLQRELLLLPVQLLDLNLHGKGRREEEGERGEGEEERGKKGGLPAIKSGRSSHRAAKTRWKGRGGAEGEDVRHSGSDDHRLSDGGRLTAVDGSLATGNEAASDCWDADACAEGMKQRSGVWGEVTQQEENKRRLREGSASRGEQQSTAKAVPVPVLPSPLAPLSGAGSRPRLSRASGLRSQGPCDRALSEWVGRLQWVG